MWWKRGPRPERHQMHAAQLKLNAGTPRFLMYSFLPGTRQQSSARHPGFRQLLFGIRDSHRVAAKRGPHDLNLMRPSLAPIQHGIGTCAHLRSYEIHNIGGSSSAQYHRRMNECITTKRTASVRCLHPEQQIQSEILSTTPTTKTSEGLCHEARVAML